MKNRMQDLDFEQNVAFDRVEEHEFTRRAAQRFRQVVSLDTFEDEDADVIFHYLYKEMELVSFGDHLKRYIYERAGLPEPFKEVPQEVYREIVIDSFRESCTPKSMTPTTARLSSLVNNWLSQASVKRETVFLLGFGLKMTVDDVSDFLIRVLKEQDFDFTNPDEVIFYYCISHRLGYAAADEYRRVYSELQPGGSAAGGTKSPEYNGNPKLDTEEELISYLSWLKTGHEDPLSEKSRAFKEFMVLYDRSREIVASLYQQDEDELKSGVVWKAENITPSDMEKVICSGIPINNMGNLKKMSASILAKHFSQKRFSRQRITNILNHKFPVERFDLITLQFFIVSQELDEEDPFNRYREFLDRIQAILKRCGMGEIYIVNPYECFILMCLLTDCPLAVFSEIWEMSYEEGSQTL